MSNLNYLYNNAKKITFSNHSRFIIMSDIHRGIGRKSDDFLKNKELYFSVLKKYYKNDFTYIELGDGEELWENRKISKITEKYLDIYLLFKKFYKKGRIYFIYGNHDKIKQRDKYVRENLYKYFDKKTQSYKSLFKDIKVYETIVMQHRESKGSIFLLHGHQVDFINNELWIFTRFLVRTLWKQLENLGVKDPTRTAKIYKKKLSVERRLSEWLCENKCMLIAGHTHKPMFSDFGIPAYFNDGSCVSDGGITTIEIENGKISLVKWSYSEQKDKKKLMKRDILAGPVEIEKYFKLPLSELNKDCKAIINH